MTFTDLRVLRSENRVVRWFDAALDGTEFLHGSFADFRFAPHLHEGYAIGVIEAGAQAFRPARRSRVLMPQGKLCVIDPGVVHEGRPASEAGWAYRMFYPSVELVSRAIDAEPGDPRDAPMFGTHVIDDPGLFRMFRALHHVSASRRNSRLAAESRALLFLAALIARHTGRSHARPVPADPPRVARLREFLHANWARPLGTRELAQLTGLSETHTIRLFSRHTGMPPHAYQLAIRVERAKLAIRRGEQLRDAALSAGFYDQSQMSRHFTRLVGVTPGRYARKAGMLRTTEPSASG
jgi:AraC-like DNA-binding protein